MSTCRARTYCSSRSDAKVPTFLRLSFLSVALALNYPTFSTTLRLPPDLSLGLSINLRTADSMPHIGRRSDPTSYRTLPDQMLQPESRSFPFPNVSTPTSPRLSGNRQRKWSRCEVGLRRI